jgi:hypothetical protein
MGLLRLCCCSLHLAQQHVVCASCPPRLFERREKIPHTFAEGDALSDAEVRHAAHIVLLYLPPSTHFAFVYTLGTCTTERERHDLRWWKCTPRACECVEQGVLFVHSTLAALLSARTCMRLKWKMLWGVSAWDLVRAGESWAADCEQWVILSLEILKAKKEKYPTAFLKL